MFGEFGAKLDDSPYVIEHLIDHIAEEESAEVRLQLLTSAVRLFFHRPPECQRMLGRLLEHEIGPLGGSLGGLLAGLLLALLA